MRETASSRIESSTLSRRRRPQPHRTEPSPPPAGDVIPAISLQLDPENYPFTAYGEFGREHYPNFLVWLQRAGQAQAYLHGPIAHQDIVIDAKDDVVFVTAAFASAWGLYSPVVYVYHFDPLGSGKAVSQEIFLDGPTAKYRNYTGFQAWLADGFVPPEPPPLPAAPCQLSLVPPLGYTGCTSMFASPSNTPAELANIEGSLAAFTNFALFAGTQNPSFLNSWLASFADPSNVNIANQGTLGTQYFTTVSEYVQWFTTNSGFGLTQLSFAIESVVAVVC